MMNDVETSAGLASIGLLQASFSPEQRDRIAIMERVKARVLWTDRDTQVTSAFNDLLGELVMRVDPERPLGPGNRREAKALVVLGKTGAGKTSLLSRTFSSHPAFPGYNVPHSGCSLVTISVPSPYNLKSLGVEILACLGYPLAREMSIPLIWRKVAERLELLGILILHLDEIHNVLEAVNARELRDVRKTFKSLLASPRWPVMLVVSGLPEVQGFFEGLDADDDEDREGIPRPAKADTKGETRRRARFVELPSLTLPHDIDMMSAAASDLAGLAGLGLQTDAQSTIAPRLIHAALHELGTAMELCHEAIEAALKNTAQTDILRLNHFAEAYRIRTGCGAEENPFLAPDWSKTDCTLVLKKNREAAEAARLRGRRR